MEKLERWGLTAEEALSLLRDCEREATKAFEELGITDDDERFNSPLVVELENIYEMAQSGFTMLLEAITRLRSRQESRSGGPPSLDLAAAFATLGTAAMLGLQQQPLNFEEVKRSTTQKCQKIQIDSEGKRQRIVDLEHLERPVYQEEYDQGHKQSGHTSVEVKDG